MLWWYVDGLLRGRKLRCGYEFAEIWTPRLHSSTIWICWFINSLRPRSSRRHFADDMFKCISLIENVSILIQISLKFVPKGSISNNPSLFQIMAWRRPGDKPLSEPMMVSSLTHLRHSASMSLNHTLLNVCGQLTPCINCFLATSLNKRSTSYSMHYDWIKFWVQTKQFSDEDIGHIFKNIIVSEHLLLRHYLRHITTFESVL